MQECVILWWPVERVEFSQNNEVYSLSYNLCKDGSGGEYVILEDGIGFIREWEGQVGQVWKSWRLVLSLLHAGSITDFLVVYSIKETRICW